jgi:hypothetical protein
MLRSLVFAVRREKTRCWKAWYWQFRKKKLDAGIKEALFWQFGKKKLDAAMLGSFVLAVPKEKTSTGSLVLTM